MYLKVFLVIDSKVIMQCQPYLKQADIAMFAERFQHALALTDYHSNFAKSGGQLTTSIDKSFSVGLHYRLFLSQQGLLRAYVWLPTEIRLHSRKHDRVLHLSYCGTNGVVLKRRPCKDEARMRPMVQFPLFSSGP